MAVYNIDKISNWYSDFINIKNKFNNTYYSDYKSCYIRNCTDDAVNKMRTKLNNRYLKIQKIYNNINNTWKDYLTDLKNTDNRLAGGKGSISANSVSSRISKLPVLREYSSSLEVKVKSISGATGLTKIFNWAENKGRTTSEILYRIYQRCSATIATAEVAVVEGLGKFVETAVDLLAIVTAAGASISFCVFDLANYVKYKYTGNEDFMTNYTKNFWEETRSFVSTNYTEQIFNSFYDNTTIGKYIKETAYGFDTVREIGVEIGEVIGVVLLAFGTGGSSAAFYGASKVAEHTEENWQDENISTFIGLLKGTFQGVSDGIFFELGSRGDKITQKSVQKLFNNGGKTILKKTGILFGKMLYEGATSIVQDCSSIWLDTLFSNDSITDENGQVIKFNNLSDRWNYYYEQAGGIKGLFTSFATASILSGLSDSFDIYGVKNSTSSLKNADMDADLIVKESSDINPNIKNNQIKVFADYNGNLKKYIYDGIPENLSDVEKARYIYCKLNNEVSYSRKWNSKKLVAIDEIGIYNKKIDLNNYFGEEVVCSNWSEMYAELLSDYGINCYVRGNNGSHKWCVFESNDKYYMADATNVFSKANDLTRMQGGAQSYGFMEITKEQAMSNTFASNTSNVIIAHKNSGLNVDELDKKLGFNYEDADKLFSSEFKDGNSKKELKHLGVSSNATTQEIIEAKLEKDLFQKLNDMGTMEGLMYFQNRKQSVFTSNELQNIRQKWIVNKNTGDMSVLYIISDGKKYLYSGKNNIKVVNDDFVNNYLNYGFIDYTK